MKKWIGSRLNRKLCLCFLIVSLIPLCLVYFYINSRYSEKLRSDAVFSICSSSPFFASKLV